jgi:autotransporter-associated beta strand protein
MSSRLGYIAIAILLLPYSSSIEAADLIWNVPSGDWSTPDNWGGTEPTSNDVAYIQNGGTASVTQYDETCGSLYLGGSDVGTIEMSGGSLSLGSAYIGDTGTGIFTQSGGTNTIASALVLGSSTDSSGTYNLTAGTLITKSISKGSGTAAFNFGGGTLQCSSNFYTELPMTLTGIGGNANFDTAGYNFSLVDILSGTGGLNKVGAGTLVLSNNNNSFTGQVTISGGALSAPYPTSLGGYGGTAGNLQMAGGVLELTGSNFSRPLGTGAGQVDLSGVGGGGFSASGYIHNVNLGGNYAPVTWGSGAFVADGQPLLFGSTTAASTVIFQNPLVLGSADREIKVFDNPGSTTDLATLSGDVSGNGGIIKTGNGSLIFTGVNTFSGGTTINGGTLANGTDYSGDESSAALGTGAVTINNGAQLRFGGKSNNLVHYYVPNDIVINNGTIYGNDGGQHLQGKIAVNGPATIRTHWKDKDIYIEGELSGAGSLTVTSDGGNGAPGLLHLTNANPFSGTITILSGVNGAHGLISVENNNALANATVIMTGNSEIQFTVAAPVFGALSGTGDLTLPSGSLTIGGNNASTVYNGHFLNNNNPKSLLIKTGTGTLSLTSPISYFGVLNINGGLINTASLVNINFTAFNFDGGGLQFAGVFDPSIRPMTFQAGGAIIDTQDNNITFANMVGKDGPGGLTKRGNGILTLALSPFYYGPTVIQGGTLQLGSSGSGTVLPNTTAVNLSSSGAKLDSSGNWQTIGSLTGVDGSEFILGGSTLTTGGDNTSTVFAGAITSTTSGSLTKLGTGTFTLAGANTFSGAVNFYGGSIKASNLNNLGNGARLNFNGGGLQFDDVFDPSVRVMTFQAGGATLDTQGHDVTLANAIGNFCSGGLIKQGSGTLTLGGSNTYFGDTKIYGGNITLANLNALQYSTLDYNNYGGTLSFGAGTILGGLKGNQDLYINVTMQVGNNNQSTTYSGSLSGPGPLTKIGTGTLTLSGSNTFTGPINFNGGLIKAASLSNLSNGPPLVFNGGGLQFDGVFDPLVRPMILQSAGGTLDTQGYNITLANTIIGNGGLIKQGSGILILNCSTPISYTGTTYINEGTLQIGNGGSAGYLGNGPVINNGILAFNKIGDLSVANTISGNGSLKNDGSGVLALTGINSFTGPIYFNGGLISASALNNLGNGAELKFNGGGLIFAGTFDPSVRTMTFQAGGATLSNSMNITLANPIGNGGNGSLTKLDSGKLTFNSLNTYSGNTIVNGGTLEIAGGIDSGGTSLIDVQSGKAVVKSVNVSKENLDIHTAALATFEVFDGTHNVGVIGGGGITQVDSGANLTVISIFQDTLSIGSGATVAIRPIPGGPLSREIVPVPEPSSLVLLIGMLILLTPACIKKGLK